MHRDKNMELKKRFIRHFKHALCISLGTLCLSITHATQPLNTKKDSNVVLQSYLIQERNAANLVSKSIRVGDITWTYNEGGLKSKPTVVLIHGLAGNRDNWNRVASYLTQDYHVIIPDLPTIRDTLTPHNFDISIPNMSFQLRQFAEALDIENNLNIAGHSLGGSIATVYAAQYPFDTQSLFLLSSAGIYKHANTPYAKDPKNLKSLLVSKPGDFDTVLQKLMETPPSVPNDLKIAQEKALISQSPKTRQAIDQIIKLNRIYTPDTFARLTQNVEAPTLILWGKKDQIINYQVAEELQALFKRAEKPVILNNVGHMPIIEAEKLVAQHYLPFLSKTQHLKNPLADKLIPLN